VERGRALASLSQTAGEVTVDMRCPDRVEVARFACVIGCDGAHSTVREALGIGFPGEDYPYELMLGDVPANLGLSTGIQLPALRLGGRRDGRFSRRDTTPGAEPVQGVDVSLRSSGAGRPPVSRSTASRARVQSPALEQLQDAAEQALPGVGLSDLRWSSLFRISLRLANRYRDGCVFVGGDAAHIHPLTGGQDMNTGIQDATNLAWKLAHVLKRGADSDLLASYEVERSPIAEAVLEVAQSKPWRSGKEHLVATGKTSAMGGRGFAAAGSLP
jgi:2-polyprenyl-6-methoxyphenol hydroxylase-like FAD-dependent oxidoreductase